MIKKIRYDEILPIWETKLWLERKDPIEPVSCMRYLGGYDQNHNMPATYFAWVENGEIVGVNSGHLCADGSYRSRGLWVNPSFRGRGIGKQLLLATIHEGRGSEFIWSFPRQSSWKTYQSAGFSQSTDWAENINNVNAYCVMEYI